MTLTEEYAHLYDGLAELGVYPDVEVALLDLLAPIAPTVTNLVRWQPEDLPAIRVGRVAGGDDEEQVSDEALVSIRCYAINNEADPRAVQDLARRVRVFFQRLNDSTGAFAAGTFVEKARKQSGPTSQPFAPDSDVRVCEFIYRVTVRD